METKLNYTDLKKTARWSGVLYLLLLLLGPLALMVVPEQIHVPGDPAATLMNLGAKESLFRLGMLAQMLIVFVELILPIFLYRLFAPVNKTLAAISASSRLGMAVLIALNVVVHFGILILAGNGGNEAEVAGQVDFLFQLHLACEWVWQGLFGLHCAFLGVVIYRSNYMPRIFGWLMGLAAFGYLLSSLGQIMYPGAENAYLLVVTVGAMGGEVPLLIWLMWKGVRPGEPMQTGTASAP